MNNLNKYLDTAKGYAFFKVLTNTAKLPLKKVLPIYNNKWVFILHRTYQVAIWMLSISANVIGASPKKAHLRKFAR